MYAKLGADRRVKKSNHLEPHQAYAKLGAAVNVSKNQIICHFKGTHFFCKATLNKNKQSTENKLMFYQLKNLR